MDTMIDPWSSGQHPRSPGEGEEDESDTEETPPGEHKREPIKDPDPADTELQA